MEDRSDLVYNIIAALPVYRCATQPSEQKSKRWFEQFFLCEKTRAINFRYTAVSQQHHKIPVAGMWPYDDDEFFQVRKRKYNISFPSEKVKGGFPKTEHEVNITYFTESVGEDP